ncbi:MAG: helix-turn-helix transcriptional regulator [Caulobacteraceae bacterium]|nr:helix-turn-helix transcriptional regulator [Caulobacteraceae bacterium]
MEHAVGQVFAAIVDTPLAPTSYWSPESTHDVSLLSPRERQILTQIGQGRSNKEIARALGSSPETIKSHVKSIFIKLDVSRRAQAVLHGQLLGLLRTG